MDYKVLNLTQKDEWKIYLNKLPIEQQDIYFTPEYYELYEKNGDGKAKCFVFEKDGDIALYPFLINSVNDLGYDLDEEYYDIQGAYGYNGVVSSSYAMDFIDQFYISFNSYCLKKRIIAEFTRFHPFMENHIFNNKYRKIYFDRKTIQIDLKKYKSINTVREKSYKKEARKNIKKFLKNNLITSIARKKDEFMCFYELYFNTMKRIDADSFYYFNKNFFKYLFHLPKKNRDLILVWDKRELVGGFFVLYYDFYAHNYLSASSYTHRKLKINEYMQDAAIDMALKKNCKKMHLGGGTTIADDDSLFKFKRKFSDKISNFYIGKKIHNQEIYNEVVNKWRWKFPEREENYKNLFLKYRYY